VMDNLESLIVGRLFDSDHIALIMTDAEGMIVRANRHTQNLLGYRREEIEKKSVGKLHLSDKSYQKFIAKVRGELVTGQSNSLEYPFRHKEGYVVWLCVSGQEIKEGGYTLWTALDISRRKKAEEDLAILKERLEYAIEGNHDVVWDWDIVHNKLDLSERWREVVGYDREDVPYEIKVWRRLLHPEDRRKALEKVQACIDGKNKYLDITYRLRHKSGHNIWILLRAVTLYDEQGKAVRMVGTHRDITHTKELELRLQEQAETIEQQRDELWYQAHHDALTALPNRIYFQQLLIRAIEQADLQGEKLALLFVDLDHFKEINDAYGHDVGDRVLRYAADLLRRGVRRDDVIARLGGDEFVLILPDVSRTETIDRIVKKLMTIFGHPFEWAGGSLDLSISIGIALYPDDAGDADMLLRRADQAMYQVKRSGRGHSLFYHSTMPESRHGVLHPASHKS